MNPAIQRRFLLQHGSGTAIGRVSWSGYHWTDKADPIETPMRPYGNYAMVYLLEGGGYYRTAQGAERKVRAGDLIITFPDIPRHYGPITGQPWGEFYIIFDGPVFDLWRTRGLLDPRQPIRHLEPLDYWRRRFEQVVTRYDTSEQYALERVCLLQELIGELVRFWRHQDVATEDRAWLAQAYAMLDAIDPCRPADYPTLAAKQGMSYEGFRKRFTLLAGSPPGQYLAKARIRKVCEVLEQTDMKLHQIAGQYGFTDEFHLSKRFKQLVGITPREFRRRASQTPRAQSSRS